MALEAVGLVAREQAVTSASAGGEKRDGKTTAGSQDRAGQRAHPDLTLETGPVCFSLGGHWPKANRSARESGRRAARMAAAAASMSYSVRW
jgi:hypothetical protein